MEKSENEKLELVRKQSSAVEKAALRAKRIVTGMVADTLALARRESDTSPAKPASPLDSSEDAERLYQRGLKCQEDGEYAEAFQWFREAAEKGLAEAQNELARCFAYGLGVPQDYAESAKWYREAAEQGLAEAQRKLGLDYEGGLGVPLDHREAVKWYRKAADQDDALAQYFLVDCYENGVDVPQSDSDANKWLRKAAEQGLDDAQCKLGLHYELGKGVAQDSVEAIKWYCKAADQGLAEAQSNLTRCCQEIVWKFSDLLALHTPLIGDCSLLPYPKRTILHAIYVVKDDYETTREATTNQALRESCDKIIPTLNYLLTRLVDDWQEIDQEDKEAIVKLGRFDSFPNWALPLKIKYLDDERASREAAEMAIQVMADKINREKIRTANT